MNFVIAYDISNDKKRLKISKTLEDYGDRIQESVFELTGIDNILWKRCQERLKKIELEDTDSIRIYQICEKCRKTVQILGHGRAFHEPEVYIV